MNHASIRVYPHSPRADMLPEQLASSASSAISLLDMVNSSRTEELEESWVLQAELNFELAFMSYALLARDEEVQHQLAEGAHKFVHAIDSDEEFESDELCQALCAALVVGDAACVARCASVTSTRFGVEGVEIHPLGREADMVLQRFAADDPLAASRLASLDARMAKARLPKAAAKEIESLTSLLRPLLAGDAAALSTALSARATFHADRYGTSDLRNYPTSFLDLTGLGIAAIARHRGMRIQGDSVYHPLSLIQG